MAHTDLEDLVKVAARLGLPIPAIYRQGVMENLDRLFDQARLVMTAPLHEPAEPAGEFQPRQSCLITMRPQSPNW
jgi:hypothetical protein